MEATHHFYGMGMAEVRRIGKRSLEWDLNDWKWDGDLFIASQLNPTPTTTNYQSRQFFPPAASIPATGNSSNSTSSCSDEVNLGLENEKDLEKRRRVVGFEHDNPNEVAGALSLNLGGDGKKAKLPGGGGGSSSRAVCQVEDCGADLSNAKDYHRRHKVCEAHSKASSALVGSTMQRFCQQCSRFHTLDEFDEGKRSCRRRLAGHNKRRRKTHPDAVKGNALNDEQSCGYLLISLLKIISNMQSNGLEQMSNQDLLSNILKILASNASVHGERNMSEVLQEPNEFSSGGTAIGNSKMVSALLANGPQGTSGANEQQLKMPAHEIPQKQVYADDATGRDMQIASSSKVSTQFVVKDSSPAYSEFPNNAVERIKRNTFDLNDEYVDLEDYSEDIERLPAAGNLGNGSLECPLWIQQDSNHSSPPPTSGHSDSTSAQSPSSSGGDVQVRTDRIVFKLFEKEPKDIPVLLRAQVLDWLAHRPTDIESYIRPGCIILTIYLCLPESAWEELCCDLSSSLSRLLDVTHDTFWRTGWFYIRVQHQIAFIYDGQVVLDTPLLRSNIYNKILSVKPIAVSVSEKAHFVVKGLNLSQPGTRLLCGLEGKYLFQEVTHELIEDGVKPQCLNFFCSIPMEIGRGFIEIEDEGLGSTCFPFIVADKDVCSEICMLESAIEFNEVDEDIQKGSGKLEAKNEATNFIHEMGWLLHRSHLKSRLSHSDPNTAAFPLERFKWLMEFSMEHDWCAVVKKLLDIFLEGTVGAGEHATLIVALREIGLLHRAVRRNCRPLVEILLRYVPGKVADELGSEFQSPTDGVNGSLLFRPNAVGPGGLTPLHIAAGRDGSEDVLDALTNDPGMVGVETWKSARDTTGCTPEDYARLRGHYSYIHLIQRKNNKRAAGGQVVLDMPGDLSDTKSDKTHLPSFEVARTELKPVRRNCSRCDRKLSYGNAGRSLVYRPAMLSMVAIAAVCVCVALLFKSSPLVYRQLSFRWEWLEYGPR